MTQSFTADDKCVCPRCGNEWGGSDVFMTCRRCRIPDTAKRRTPRFQEGSPGGRRGQEQRESIHETKYGVD
jgi:hypothetical protein